MIPVSGAKYNIDITEIVIDKRHTQLGMNPSTAQQRLVKDILYKFVVETGRNSCCKCGLEMERSTFSIEHIVPWLDSSDPLGNFFDLSNISFSHLKCNVGTARRTNRKYSSKEEAEAAAKQKDKEWRERNPYVYDSEKRRERYKLKGY